MYLIIDANNSLTGALTIPFTFVPSIFTNTWLHKSLVLTKYVCKLRRGYRIECCLLCQNTLDFYETSNFDQFFCFLHFITPNWQFARPQLNLVRCGTCNMFRFSDGIPPQGGRPTFTSIARNKAYISGSTMLRLTIKLISLNSVNELVNASAN